MARRRRSGGLTPQGAVQTFLPMAVAFPLAGAAMGAAGSAGTAATAAGMPAAGGLMGVASMGVASRSIGLAMGGMGKKRRI